MTDHLNIALAQINPTVGDLKGNTELIRKARSEAADQGADLVVATELSISGYPPEDLVLKPAFVAACREAVEALAKDTADGGPGLVVGSPWVGSPGQDESPEGAGANGRPFNAALLLDDGRVQTWRAKYDLPNYSVFDEKRVFQAGPLPGPVNVRGVRLGLMVCEDMWTSEVAECLQESGAEILVVPNGSPYEMDKVDQRLQLGVARVTETGLPLVYVNQVGGQDELVFDGGSFVLNGDCSLAAQLPMFEACVVTTEWTRGADDRWHCAEGPGTAPQEGAAAIYRALLLARVWLSSITFQYRLHQLGKLFLWALATLFVGANVLHITEIAFDGEAGPFGGYWRSYWNILIVLVSGIEDKEPISLLGRIEVTLLLIAGIVIVGMLTGEIVSILIRRVQRAGKVALKPPSGRFERHVVILGNNGHIDAVIRQVNTALHGLHHILVVHPDADQLPITAARAYRRVFALPGEPRDTRTLEAADIDRAARVIVLAPPAEQCDSSEPDNRALMATVAVVCRKASIPLVVELTDERNLRYTHGLPEVDFVVGRAFGERMISQAVLNPGITEVYDHLLNSSGDSNELYTMPVPKRLVGKTFSDAQLHFLDRDEEAITLVGIDRSPRGNPNSVFTLCPQAPEADAGEDELVLGSNDRLVLLAYHRPTTMGPDTEDRWSPTRLARE